jgi:hypothetical protein
MPSCRLNELLALSLSSCCSLERHRPRRPRREAKQRPVLPLIRLTCRKFGMDGGNSIRQSRFYAKGEHIFFDVAPLKYASWPEYQAGVVKELSDYKSAKFTVNS